jgi:hypothetical protein
MVGGSRPAGRVRVASRRASSVGTDFETLLAWRKEPKCCSPARFRQTLASTVTNHRLCLDEGSMQAAERHRQLARRPPEAASLRPSRSLIARPSGADDLPHHPDYAQRSLCIRPSIQHCNQILVLSPPRRTLHSRRSRLLQRFTVRHHKMLSDQPRFHEPVLIRLA